MSDQPTTDAPPSDPADQPQEGDQQAKTFDADYVRKLREEAAKYRTEAKANADAAKRLAEIEEASKTEAQKQADRLAAAEAEAQQARAEALRFKVAAKFQVSDEDAELFLTGTDEATLTKQAQRLTERDTERKKHGNHVPREGATSAAIEGDERSTARALFGGPH